MTSDTHIAMHHDHRTWQGDASAWRDDMRTWQEEIVGVLGDLHKAEKVFQDHFDHMRQHASAVRLHEMDTDEHEHSLVQYERGGGGEGLIEKAKSHAKEAARHEELRKVHEHMKQYQHNLMAAAVRFVTAVKDLSKSQASK